MVNNMGLNLVLHLTLCLFLVSVDVSDSSSADIQFEPQHYSTITYNEDKDNNSNVETISLNDHRTSINIAGNENTAKAAPNQSAEYSLEKNITDKINNPENGIITEMQPSESIQEYNGISFNDSTLKWKPKSIGVATWYEISLTGRRTASNVYQWLENGKHMPSSSSRVMASFQTNSRIGFLFIMIKFTLQHYI